MDAYFGEIRLFPYTFPPVDWSYCNGDTVNATQNPALYSILSNYYGGTYPQFKLPDLRGRTAIGAGQGPGLTARKLAQQVGEATVTLTSAQIPHHTHALNGSFNNDPSIKPGPSPLANVSYFTFLQTQDDASNTYATSQSPNTTLAQVATGPTGSGAAHDNHQPYLVFNYFICTNGIYPPRPN